MVHSFLFRFFAVFFVIVNVIFVVGLEVFWITVFAKYHVLTIIFFFLFDDHFFNFYVCTFCHVCTFSCRISVRSWFKFATNFRLIFFKGVLFQVLLFFLVCSELPSTSLIDCLLFVANCLLMFQFFHLSKLNGISWQGTFLCPSKHRWHATYCSTKLA